MEKQHLPATSGAILCLDIGDREPAAFAGEEFAGVGRYERISGRVHGELDPLHRLNAGIVNLDRAPRNVAGRVEYTTDFCVLQPVNPARGNGFLFYEIVNRGTQQALQYFNSATSGETGNGFLMRRGFTIAWSGWQGGLAPAPGRLVAGVPVATDGGKAIIGRSREEFIADAPGSSPEPRTTEIDAGKFIASLGYPAASLDPAGATLTVRNRERDPRATPPGLAWRYLDAMRIEITRPDGAEYDRGAIYEFIYTARDPLVLGIGLPAMRDFMEFLRRPGPDNPLTGEVRHAIGFGLSQSGRVLRDFVHHGFNRSLSGERVFDAIMPVIAGSRRCYLNAAFAQPGRYPRQHEDHTYPDDQFPFTYTTLRDPISGKTGGILARAEADCVGPKVMHVDTDAELWSARASLVVTDSAGNDIAQPDDVRVYLAATHQHSFYSPPPAGVVRHGANPLCYQALLRPLLVALCDWVAHGAPPPASRFPSRGDNTLVALDEARGAFPAIPGAQFPEQLNELRLLDHGVLPPAEGAAYPVFVARPDADGNALGGLRHPLLHVPVGTHTGWNIRAPGYAAGDLYTIMGSYFPFAATRDERGADPRPSLAERYATPAGRAQRLEPVIAAMLKDRLLLPEDADRLRQAASASWDAFAAT